MVNEFLQKEDFFSINRIKGGQRREFEEAWRV